MIADEHPATILGIRSTLEQAGFEVSAEATSFDAALRAAQEHHLDICLIDIELEGRGVELAACLSRLAKASVVIVLSSSENDERFIDAIAAGASGYLFKDIAPDKLFAALRGALANEAAVPRSLTARLIEALRERRTMRVLVEATRGANLTRREADVLRLLRENLTTEEVAKRLSISPVTVRTHLSSIVRKCQAKDRNAVLQMFGDLEQNDKGV